MKKAFTLIELLVVIAIIAILAAILFPVFAQAKAAAKKTAGISNQKQIGAALQIYMGDYDDTFPRNDDCELNSSLNPQNNGQAAGTDPSPWCNGSNGYPYRMNHYSWQKWVLPYSKNVQLFEHPGRSKVAANTFSCPGGTWAQCGQIMGGFAINLALTGALNTWGRTPTSAGYTRNSWLGGNQTALPDVSRAMMLFEFTNVDINFSPVVVDAINNPIPNQIVYPMAIREFWAANFKRTDAACNPLPEDNAARTFGGVIITGYADSSAKAVPINQWLAFTPTAAQYGVTVDANAKCGISSGTYRPGVTPNLAINFPFWALQG
ncbi:MAG: prepilin-type N-terminal cleavage/methylation domain-containing protein [Fimbriimonadaceae bacterium]|nr:prepilin-type N-terminal cleavage/methylation domain-containing protein [Fimbriimonadaceae bacterium]